MILSRNCQTLTNFSPSLPSARSQDLTHDPRPAHGHGPPQRLVGAGTAQYHCTRTRRPRAASARGTLMRNAPLSGVSRHSTRYEPLCIRTPRPTRRPHATTRAPRRRLSTSIHRARRRSGGYCPRPSDGGPRPFRHSSRDDQRRPSFRVRGSTHRPHDPHASARLSYPGRQAPVPGPAGARAAGHEPRATSRRRSHDQRRRRPQPSGHEPGYNAPTATPGARLSYPGYEPGYDAPTSHQP
jgi:hypothetical protein